MKKIFFFLLFLATIYSCTDSASKKSINDDPVYLSEKDYNEQFDTAARHFLYERYRIFENKINRCMVEGEFSSFLQTKLKTLMWRPGRVLLNSLDSASDTRELMLMDNRFYTFNVRTFNNNHNASIKAWDSVKIHGEMIGIMYEDHEDGLSDPTFIAIVDSIKILERGKSTTREK